MFSTMPSSTHNCMVSQQGETCYARHGTLHENLLKAVVVSRLLISGSYALPVALHIQCPEVAAVSALVMCWLVTPSTARKALDAGEPPRMLG